MNNGSTTAAPPPGAGSGTGLGTAAPAFMAPDKAPPQPFIQWPGVK